MKANLEQIRIWVPKGSKQIVMDYAGKNGMSMTEYIIQLIEKDMGTQLKHRNKETL